MFFLILVEAIEKSRLIFKWCGDKLASINECIQESNILANVLPHGKVGCMQSKTKSYGDSMTAHKKIFGKD